MILGEPTSHKTKSYSNLPAICLHCGDTVGSISKFFQEMRLFALCFSRYFMLNRHCKTFLLIGVQSIYLSVILYFSNLFFVSYNLIPLSVIFQRVCSYLHSQTNVHNFIVLFSPHQWTQRSYHDNCAHIGRLQVRSHGVGEIVVRATSIFMLHQILLRSEKQF